MRFLCTFIAAALAYALSAQEVEQREVLVDSLAEQQEVTPSSGSAEAVYADVPALQAKRTDDALYRAWLRSHPVTEGVPAMSVPDDSHLLRADSLWQSVLEAPLEAESTRYLYNMRLPLTCTGTVPSQTPLTVTEEMAHRDEQDQLPESFVTDRSATFTRQSQLEEERMLARFRYGSADLRRYRFARRHFDVPTDNFNLFDTEASLANARVVDDLNLDFSNATLEDFNQQLLVIKADKWHWKGDHTLQMQQTSLSDNWYQGGDNNMSLSGDQKLSISRFDEKQKTTFEMVLDLKLSAFYTKADTIHALKVSDNLFTWDVKFGYKAWKRWYYSSQLYAKTPVFKYYSNNSHARKSSFLSPLEVNYSVGMEYKYTSPGKAFSYSLLLAPLSYNVKYVRDDRVDETAYGLDEGDTSLHEFGSTLTNKFEWQMGPNAKWSSRLYCFTSYHSVLVEFENTFSFNISRYFSARIYAYPRFDDSKDSDVQTKEMVTFGFNYAW